MPGLQPVDLVYSLQETVDASLWNERGAKIRHQNVAHEKYALLRHMHEEGIGGFSTACRHQTKASLADYYITWTVDQDIRLVGEHVVESEFLSEETLQHRRIAQRVIRELFLIGASTIEAHSWIEAEEIPMSAHVVPVRVRDEDRCQRRE